MKMRKAPNILVTGTPGTGKSTHAELISESDDDLWVLSINSIVKARSLAVGYDEERKAIIVDDEKLIDALEGDLEVGGCVIDWHVADVFPARLIDFVVVLRASTDVLFDRLKARNYPDSKIQENLDAEIMEVILNDAREAYDSKIIVELPSNTVDDMEQNVSRIIAWKTQWTKDNNV